MNPRPRIASSALLLALTVAACGKGDDGAAAAVAAEKAAHETAITDLKQPVALISGYSPYARYPESPGKYFPARHPDLEKSTLLAANETRYAANKARQKLEAVSSKATEALQAALSAVTQACADADEPGKLTKCTDSVKALDGALEKTGAAATALGVAGKYPRIAPESVTDEARTAMATFLKARGPGGNEKSFADKRSDPKLTPADITTACQTAQDDAAAAAQTYEKADEPIRLVAATRKMAMDSQCRRIGEITNLARDLDECKKKTKAKSTECKVICGKVKVWVDDGFPAAAFEPIAKDFADICKP